MGKIATRVMIVAAILFFSSAAAGGKKGAYYIWKTLASGIAYTTFTTLSNAEGVSTIHAFQIDPAKFKIDVATTSDEKNGATAEELAKRLNALVAINGGFFTPEHKSIGLIIKDGREINPIHKTSWWSIFAMSGNKASIYSPKEFASARDIRMALQVGPRLAVGGKIPKLKESLAERSAVGITTEGKVIIAITQGRGISMDELARIMSYPPPEGGLGCPNAMALDGGSSSQLYARFKKFELKLPGLARVTNGLAVLPK